MGASEMEDQAGGGEGVVLVPKQPHTSQKGLEWDTLGTVRKGLRGQPDGKTAGPSTGQFLRFAKQLLRSGWQSFFVIRT